MKQILPRRPETIVSGFPEGREKRNTTIKSYKSNINPLSLQPRLYVLLVSEMIIFLKLFHLDVLALTS
jgi:hypothetical protein